MQLLPGAEALDGHVGRGDAVVAHVEEVRERLLVGDAVAERDRVAEHDQARRATGSRRGGGTAAEAEASRVTLPLPIEATAPGLPIQPYADEKTWMPRVLTRYAGASRRTTHSVRQRCDSEQSCSCRREQAVPRRPRERRREPPASRGEVLATTSECTGWMNAPETRPESASPRARSGPLT